MTIGVSADSPGTSLSNPVVGSSTQLLLDPATGASVAARPATADSIAMTSVAADSAVLVNPFGVGERQRTDGGGRLVTADVDPLMLIYGELRKISFLLAEGFNIQVNLDDLGQDMIADQTVN